MSDHTKGQSTGPKTQVGKAKSSKNARKASAFTKGYLDWENHEDKRQQFEALAEQWQAYDPSREIILRSIEYAMLGQERLMNSERKRIEGRPITEAFGVALGRRYAQPNPLLNLQAVIDEIEKKYGYYLKWARDPHRYEIIIEGIRAEQMQEAMDLEKSTKYSTNFQNRILKGFAALSHLAQVEQQQLTYVAEKVSVELEQETRDQASDDQKTGDLS